MGGALGKSGQAVKGVIFDVPVCAGMVIHQSATSPENKAHGLALIKKRQQVQWRGKRGS